MLFKKKKALLLLKFFKEKQNFILLNVYRLDSCDISEGNVMGVKKKKKNDGVRERRHLCSATGTIFASTEFRH